MKYIYFYLFSFVLLFSSLVFAQTKPMCLCKTADDFFKLSRALSLKAQAVGDIRQKGLIAAEGVKAADQCLLRQKNNVGCIYYRAVNRGLDLETRTVKVKKGLKKMVADFEQVLLLNDRYDNGGAYLALGYVYLKAPKLPVMGKNIKRDIDLAENFANEALNVNSTDPENLKLAGLVAYKKKEYSKSLDYFKKALKICKNSLDQNAQTQELKDWLKKWVKKVKKKKKRKNK